jgi:hypothetical protein
MSILEGVLCRWCVILQLFAPNLAILLLYLPLRCALGTGIVQSVQHKENHES